MSESKVSMVVHYLVLVVMLIGGISGIIFWSKSRETQLIIIWLLGGGYFFWGVVHHLIHGDFHVKVLLEYFFVAAIGVLPVVALIVQR